MKTSTTHRSTRHGRWSIAALSLLALSATAGQTTAAERTIRTPYGDVVQMQAPAGKQQTMAASQAHPFATARQRAAVKPMVWTDAGPADTLRSIVPLALRKPAAMTGGGVTPALGNDIARSAFPDAWKTVDAVQARGANAAGLGIDVTPQDGAHYGYYRYPGNYYTSQWTIPPYNKIGKLYFTTPSGGSSYCTANVGSGNSVIITAAHCVYSRGQGFNSNFRFVPAERYGAAPYGSYGWTSATVLNDWINIGARRHDVAVIRLAGEQSSRQPVVNYVGWLGRSWDWGYEQSTYSHGYASNLSTQYTNICAGTTYSAPSEGADVLVQGCDMTYGSSGGAWLINFTHNSHGGNHVNSVVSGPHIGSFGTAYVGARFTSNNIVPLCNAIGC